MSNVLITGAGSGIGAGLSSGLGRAGHHVIAGDLERHDPRAIAERIRGEGGSAESVLMDVTSDTSVDAALASCRPADVLINNAGLQHVAPLEEFAMSTWEYLVQVMLIGSARLSRAVLPGMRQRGYGRIVNMGSIHSLVASPYKSAYVAAKHGLVGLSKTLALETADQDVTVNTVCPSYVRTPLVDAQIADQARTRGIPESEVVTRIMLEPMPKRVFVGVDELVAVIAFLMTAAARNITGQTIAVDGGWTAH